MRLHDTLNARRKMRGLTYEEVHEKLLAYPWSHGVKPPSLAVVGHWFNGTRRPRYMEHLRALCEVLDLTLDEAVKGAPAEAKTGVEQAMLEALRSMSAAKAEALLAVAKGMEDK